jgi:glucose-1-phosphate thymidylyltransferase
MKALLTAGGHGTRLRPITHTQNKHLIPIANKPMLLYGLEAIAGAGIRDVGIVVGDTEDEIRAAVGDGSAWGLRVEYLPQEAPLGLAHVVLTGREFVGRDPFLMYLGDNMLRDGLSEFIRAFEENRPDAQILLAKVPDPSRYGVVSMDGDRVVRLAEKPPEFVSDLALAGFYLFTEPVFDAAASLRPSGRGELEITEAIQHMVDHGHVVRAERITGWWKDTGRVEDLLEANRFVLQEQDRQVDGDVDEASHVVGEVRVEPGAVVRDSVIRGPAAIAAGCRIERSVIDPYTSIYLNTVIADSEIGNSIVMDECRIEDVRRIRDSLIGRNVQVRRADAAPSSVQLMVGDNCAITLP